LIGVYAGQWHATHFAGPLVLQIAQRAAALADATASKHNQLHPRLAHGDGEAGLRDTVLGNGTGTRWRGAAVGNLLVGGGAVGGHGSKLPRDAAVLRLLHAAGGHGAGPATERGDGRQRRLLSSFRGSQQNLPPAFPPSSLVEALALFYRDRDELPAAVAVVVFGVWWLCVSCGVSCDNGTCGCGCYGREGVS